MKTNRQIADECAQAAWSWLCEQYEIPIPSIQQLISLPPDDERAMQIPEYRVSMSHRKSSVPGIPGSSEGHIVISGTSLSWLPNCRTNNTIESWTLQFVGEFTRLFELRKQRGGEGLMQELAHVAMLNKIEFARQFFPHLYRAHKENVRLIRQKSRTELTRLRNIRPEQPEPSPHI